MAEWVPQDVEILGMFIPFISQRLHWPFLSQPNVLAKTFVTKEVKEGFNSETETFKQIAGVIHLNTIERSRNKA